MRYVDTISHIYACFGCCELQQDAMTQYSPLLLALLPNTCIIIYYAFMRKGYKILKKKKTDTILNA